MSDVTRLLDEFHNDGRLSEELIELVYEELRRIAEGQFANEKPGQTLQATAVVHEAYLRLFSGLPRNWENRRHFFGAAAGAICAYAFRNWDPKPMRKRYAWQRDPETNNTTEDDDPVIGDQWKLTDSGADERQQIPGWKIDPRE